MSTDFSIVNKRVSIDEIFDGRLEEYEVVEIPESEKTAIDDVENGGRPEPSGARWLTDGRNVLAVWPDEPVCFTWYKPNGSPEKILDAIAACFDAEICCEHQPQYWGFETEEEWEWARTPVTLTQEHKEEF
jgi:hypothetical protein